MSEEYEDIWNDGYKDGYDEALTSAEKELWRSLTRWLVKRGDIDDDAPDGNTADDLMQAVLAIETRARRVAIEECAKVADEHAAAWTEAGWDLHSRAAARIAKALRASK